MTRLDAQSMQDATPASTVFVIGVPLLRWGLEKLIESTDARYQVTGTAVRWEDALEMLERQPSRLAVLVVDGMPIRELAEFCRRSPARAVLVTSSADAAWLDEAVLAGARAVVHTTDSPDVFLRALQKVSDGELWIPRSAATRIFIDMAQRRTDPKDAEQSKIGTLTLRERQTIAAVVSNAAAPGKVIASALCISEHTLRNHLTSIYSKLGLANRLDLYAYALRHAIGESPLADAAGRPATGQAPPRSDDRVAACMKRAPRARPANCGIGR